MTSPSAEIALLDRDLARTGQPAKLRRSTWHAGTRVDDDVTVTAFVRDYAATELTGGVMQGDTKVTLSPSPIIARGWPANPPTDGTDPLVPIPGDTVIIAGRARTVVAPAPKYLQGVLVRIDLQVRG